MSTLKQLLTLISSNCSGNAWSDWIAEQAESLLQAFTENDWAELDMRLAELPDAQLTLLADALCGIPPAQANSRLLRIIGLEKRYAAIAACNSLRTHLQSAPKKMAVDGSIIVRIRQIEAISDEPWRSGCRELLKYLEPSSS